MYKRGICLNAIYSDIMYSYQNLESRVRALAGSDIFNGVEFYFKGTAEEYEKTGRLMEELGLYTVFLAGYEMKQDGVDLGSRDKAKRLDAIEKTKKFIDTAHALRSRKMLILSGPRPTDEEAVKKSVENTIDSLDIVLDYAARNPKDYDLDIVLEFFNDHGEPYLTVGNIDTVAYICENLCPQYDNFSITFDTSHVKQLGEDLFASYRRLMPYINHVHFSNCVTRDKSHPLYGDKHPLFNIENGDFDDTDMIQFMDHIDKHRGLDRMDIFSYEVICPDIKSGDKYYREVAESARQVFGLREKEYGIASSFESEGRR